MKMYQVDAFTQQLFKGNSAAGLVLEEWLSDDLMQNIALENNLAETAFVKKIDNQNYQIRWFSPTVEIDFCGHATLASAYVLFKDYIQGNNLNFHVKNLGIFNIEQLQDGKITMNFPIRKAQRLSSYPEELNHVIDRPFSEVYVNEQAFILVLENEQDVIDSIPDLEAIKQLAELHNQSAAITAYGADLDLTLTAKSEKYDFISRYFAPQKGIDEDPVTGSMHTGLAPLWADKLAKNNLIAFQASARGGELYCQLLENERIEISGDAKLYMVAEINV